MSGYKTIFYIDKFSFGGNTSDNFRKELNKLWHNQKPNGLGVDGTIRYSGKNSIKGDGCKIIFGEPRTINKKYWTEEVQSVKIYADAGEFENDTHWNAYILGGSYGDPAKPELGFYLYQPKVILNTKYYDHVHTSTIPLTRPEKKDVASSFGSGVMEIDPEYNFYVFEYEENPVILKQSELNLPALYSLASYKINPFTSLKSQLLSSDNMKENMLQFFERGACPKEYFKLFARGLQATSPSPTLRNVFFTGDNWVELEKYNELRFSFPMFSEIKFSTDTFTQFSNLIAESKVGSEFMASVCTNIFKNKADFVEVTKAPRSGKSRIRQTTNRIFDVDEWFENYDKNGPSGDINKFVFAGFENEDIQNAKGKLSKFSNKLYSTIFMGKLRTYIDSRFRTFQELFDGENAQAETIIYRVAKYKGKPKGEPLQNFWFLNKSDLDVVDFIDTQLKYNEEYSYEIYAYNFVIGTEYEYKNLAISRTVTENCIEMVNVETGKGVLPRINSNIKTNPITKGTTLIPMPQGFKYVAEFDIRSRPSMKVIETKIYTKTIRILDSPPLPPEFKIIPYIGIKNKIKLFCEGSMGHILKMPIAINKSDNKLINEIRNNRDLTPFEPIPYGTDDYPVLFEIYRMTKMPVKYSDFSGNLRATLDLKKTKLDLPSVTAAAFNDDILTNQKYYYTARSFDVHGNLSNPSPVHEIEMVEDKGASYLVHRVIDLEPPKLYQMSKSLRRFFYLIPNLGQSLINEEKSNLGDYSSAKDLENRIILGMKEETVWNKKFKLRLTSLKTGRKIDINLELKTNHERTDVENDKC